MAFLLRRPETSRASLRSLLTPSVTGTTTTGSKSLSAKWALGGVIAGSGLAGLMGAGSSALALYFARRVITPARIRDENQEILAVIRDGNRQQVILDATDDATVEGVYGLFFDS